MHYTNSVSRLNTQRTQQPRTAAIVPSLERDARGLHLRMRTASTLVRQGLRKTAATLAALACVGASAFGTISINFPTPTLDKMAYPFTPSGGGIRSDASIFGSIGSTAGQFDDRDAQFIAGFNTGGVAQSGLGAASYTIISAKFTVSLGLAAADSVIWDGTYDPISTFNADGSATAGDDPGRSIELYGVGYRNGFTHTTMGENTALIFGDPTTEGTRNFYATDNNAGVARDVSNNYRDAFNPIPFAIGQVAAADLNLDGTMKSDAHIVFTLNLANPDVVNYLKGCLDAGRVNLLVSSLHAAAQAGPVIFPNIWTKENGLGGEPAHLEMVVDVVPEPNTASLIILATAVGACWRSRRGFQKSTPLT